jgi:C4-dicarboxylate transporter DctM subunit
LDLLIIVLLFLSLALLMASGVPIAFALLGSGLLAFLVATGPQGLSYFASVFWSNASSYEFLAAPLFVFMGFLLQQSGLVSDLFKMTNAWLGRLPGSLGVVSIAMCTTFGAMSGSGGAACATLGTVIGPEARRQGFDIKLLAGLLNGGTSLAPLIPPSLAFIVYSTLSDVPLTRLFAAGVIPGLMMALMMAGYAIAVGKFQPHRTPVAEPVSWGEKVRLLRIAPVIAGVLFITLGGIFLGWFTPTEAAAIGVLVGLLLVFIHHRFRPTRSLLSIWEGSREAAVVAVFVMFLIVSGQEFAAALSFLGIPQRIAAFFVEAQLTPGLFILVISVLLLLTGIFFDGVTIQILTVPFLLPAVRALGIDPLWFGVFLVLWVEIGTFTPPVGLHGFVLQGVLKIPYSVAVMGVLPMIPIWMIGIVALILFPQLATWLPSILF